MAGEQILNGRDYVLEIDIDTPIDADKGLAYRPIVCEVSSSFGISTTDIAISNSCTGRWSSRIPNKSEFSFSGEWQAINPLTGDPDAHSLNMVAFLAGSRRMFWARRKLKTGALGTEVYREGVVWINRFEDVAAAEEPFVFSADFIGLGAPNIDAGYDVIGLLADSRRAPVVTGSDEFIVVKAGAGTSGQLVEPTIGLALGDSVVAAGNGKGMGIFEKVLTQAEQDAGYELRSLATPGDLIADQMDAWNMISDKSVYDYVIIMVGLNDIWTGGASATAKIAEYQALINRIKDTGRPGVDIIVATMTPANAKWVAEGHPEWQSTWQAMNAGTMTEILGVVGRVDSHTAKMADGSGNLLPQYNSGDGIHINDAGATVVAEEWRKELIRLKLIL